MGARREARKLAVRVLFAVDFLGLDIEEAWETVNGGKLSPKTEEFSRKLIEGTLENLEFVDGLIAKYTTNWEPERIANVDRTIIRLGLYEIYFEDSIPRNVSINEAVELAKYFSTAKSHMFVNGILDAAGKDKEKAAESE